MESWRKVKGILCLFVCFVRVQPTGTKRGQSIEALSSCSWDLDPRKRWRDPDNYQIIGF